MLSAALRSLAVSSVQEPLGTSAGVGGPQTHSEGGRQSSHSVCVLSGVPARVREMDKDPELGNSVKKLVPAAALPLPL